MLNYLWPAVLSLLGMVSLMGAAQAQTAKPRNAPLKQAAANLPTVPVRLGDAALGREKGEAERCFECHGLNGEGVAQGPESVFAKLAGQRVDYIEQQVRNFQQGLRKNDSMLITARNVSAEDLRDIAAYFAGLPPMQGSGQGANEVAALLVSQGDAARGIVACAACHGPQGQGVAGNPAPRLAGQALRYLERQLLELRHGLRREPGTSAMAAISRALSEAEITALALHFSSQQQGVTP